MIDRASQRVGQRRHEGIDLYVHIRSSLLDRAFPLPVDAGKAEQRSWLVRLQSEPVPARRLALIGLTERRRRHKARRLSKLSFQNFVCTLSSRVFVTRFGA